MSSKLRAQICYQYEIRKWKQVGENHLTSKKIMNGVALFMLNREIYAKISPQPISHLSSVILNLMLY